MAYTAFCYDAKYALTFWNVCFLVWIIFRGLQLIQLLCKGAEEGDYIEAKPGIRETTASV